MNPFSASKKRDLGLAAGSVVGIFWRHGAGVMATKFDYCPITEAAGRVSDVNR